MKVFFAFDREDKNCVDELLKHLAQPIQTGIIDVWHPGMVNAGENISVEIEKHLFESDLVLFILSSSFISSDLFSRMEYEVIRRVENKDLTLIPILYRPCLWDSLGFMKLNPQALPANGQFLSTLTKSKREVEDMEIAKTIRDLAISKKEKPTDLNVQVAFENVDGMISSLKSKVANNDLEGAFEILDQVLTLTDKPEIESSALLIKSRYNQAISDQRQGIVTSENTATTQAQIMERLLFLIDEIPREIRANSVEEGSIFLEGIKKTSGFEKEQVKFKGTQVKIFDTDSDIEEIFNELEEKWNVSSIPIFNEKVEEIRTEYERLKGGNSNIASMSLPEIRYKLGDLLEEIRSYESKKQTSSVKDVGEADILYLNEAKLILVGNGGVGKTTLRHNLTTPDYKLTKHNSTEGLEVDIWNFPITSIPGVSSFKFNIWDFGGQGRYRAIQQFYCSRNALYLFVTAPTEKKNPEYDDYGGFEYWLNYIKLFGYDPELNKESPVIFVMNKADIAPVQIDKQEVTSRFNNVRSFIKVSCKSGMGIKETRMAIEQRLQETGMINRSFPRSWVLVKDELEMLGKSVNLINYHEFLGIFEKYVPITSSDQRIIEENEFRLYDYTEEEIQQYLEDFYTAVQFTTILSFYKKAKTEEGWEKKIAARMVTEQKADTLIKYLHTIGAILFYPKVMSLADKIILNPDWARKMAYQILDSSQAAGGVLREEDLFKIFPGEGKKYSIDLLTSYQLCHKTNLRGKTKYFIPSLFPSEKPKGLIDFGMFPNVFHYECLFSPIIPADLLPRLISSQFSLVKESTLYWKNGAVFTAKGTKSMAQIFEHWEENKIVINVVGKVWSELLCLLANEIYKIGEQIVSNRLMSGFKTIETLKTEGKTSRVDLSSSRSKTINKQLLANDLLQLVDKDTSPTTSMPVVNMTDKLKEALENQKEQNKKKLLYLSACPFGKSEMRFSDELDSLDHAHSESRREEAVQIFKKMQVRADELFLELDSFEANYIHISVHGERSGNLLFVNDDKQAAKVDAEELKEIFEQLAADGKSPEMVCFSACNSKAHAKELARFVPFTIGMNGKFPVDAAVLFAKVFYNILFVNRPVKFAFQQAVRAIQRAAYVKQDDLEVHKMPHLYLDKGTKEIVL